ncbi:MAG TPA: CheR family methyltransferase [Cyclobacteriaceae bacterium]
MKVEKGKPKKNRQPLESLNLFPVVGVGASAGGLDAFKRLLKAIPENSGIAWVLVQHLDPTHESLLPELLQKVTKVPVLEISDDIRVVPDHIYIIPSNKMLVANDGVLLTSPRPDADRHQQNLPIDLFFASLAQVHQAHSIGVVLSGTAFDGTLGLKAIKDHGGITFAQDEESSGYREMPLHAVRAGVVDFVLPPERIPEKILQVTSVINGDGIPQQETDVLKQILSLLRIRKGIDFTYYKQATIDRRILRRMTLNKIREPSDYLNYLRANGLEQDLLYRDLLIPVTAFFRDPKIFEDLIEKVFPQILKRKAEDQPLRVWVAGCSTGEEAYSIAICLTECLGDRKGKAQIFATDVNETSIAKSRAGIYSKNEVDGLSPQRLREFFSKVDGSYLINKDVRDMCVFAVHNFLRDPPFGKMDFISCRNVLIYMEPYLQKKALGTFHHALNPGGILLLGKSETTNSARELFDATVRLDKIFSRKDVSGTFMPVKTNEPRKSVQDKKDDHKSQRARIDFQKSAHDIILDKYTPSGVIVNDAMEIVHFHGNNTAWLQLSSGKPTHNLLKLAKSDVAFELRNVLHKVKKTGKSVIKENIALKANGNRHLATFEVIPLRDIAEPHYLILFRDAASGSSIKTTRPLKKTVRHEKDEQELRIQQLEQELAQTREDLRFIIEDQEAANEELQSANEELQSGSEELQSLNEEMETGKEELQSANEELIVVNQELTALNEQVTGERNYSEGIVATIRSPLLVLDMNFRIRSANNAFYKTFRVNEQETEGRLLYELGNNQWDIPKLRSFLKDVLPRRESIFDFEISHQFPSIGQRTMLLNAREVIRVDAAEKLILLAIEDITERKNAEEVLRDNEERFRQLVKNLPAGVFSCDAKGTINFYNDAAVAIWGRKPVIGKEKWSGARKLVELDGAPLPADLATTAIALKEGRSVMKEMLIERPDGTRSAVQVYSQPLFGLSGEITGAISMILDVTEQKGAARKIEESEKRYNMLLMQSPYAFAILKGKDMVITLANDSIKEVWGKGANVEGKALLEVLPEIKNQPFPALLDKVYSTGVPFYAYEILSQLQRNGRMEDAYFNLVYQPYREADGIISGVTIIAIEVTPQAELNRRMKESEANFRQLAEMTPGRVTAADALGNIYYYNQSWLDYTGLSLEELVETGLDKFVHPDDAEELARRRMHSIETGNYVEMEWRVKNKNGEYIWHIGRSVPVKDSKGEILKWIGSAIEIQQQKEHQEVLEKTVSERTYELRNKNEELLKMNTELESFAYVTSHDLQEPLRKIQTFAARILTEEIPVKIRADFERVRGSALRMQTLIRDLLSFSRTSRSERILVKKGLNKIVEAVKNDLSETMDEKMAVIETKGILCEAKVIPFQFHQMMYNLIGNALKFSDPGRPPHIVIKSEIAEAHDLEKENPALRAEKAGKLLPGKEYCHISISDNGIGFDSIYRDKIFEIFQRLYNGESYQGTGIGLAIVKKIVENHNGVITAAGELDKGATFDIYIPDF